MIRDGNVVQARSEAVRKALRDASLYYSASISSQEQVVNGQLQEDRLTVVSETNIRSMRILQETRSGSLLRVEIEADVAEGQACESRAASRLRKRVAITAFPIQHVEQATLGQLRDAAWLLAARLQTVVQDSPAIQPFAAHDRALYSDLVNMPTLRDNDVIQHKTLNIAREMGVQYVIAGVIREMGPEDPSAWASSLWRQWQREGWTRWIAGQGNRQRRWVVDMVLLDGFSGVPLLEQSFVAQGEWDLPPEQVTGFGSPAFLNTPYGQAVEVQIREMARSIERAVRCQPFMTRIVQVDGRQVHLASGAAEGLRPGDEFSVYRQADVFGLPRPGVSLSEVGEKVELRRVYPTYSEGVLSKEAGRINIQVGDVLIIW